MAGFSTSQGTWAWGISLIAVTIFVHALGIVVIAQNAFKFRYWLRRHPLRHRYSFLIVVGFIAIIGALLAILHGLEAAIWAAAYLWLGALSSFEEALFWSIDSMTTRGASGLPIGPHWQMLGALEAVDGMLLFGISTAFIFAAMQAYWPMLIHAVESDQTP
jgi:hypothetical protein